MRDAAPWNLSCSCAMGLRRFNSLDAVGASLDGGVEDEE